jgi:hypothetical protein
MLELTYHTPYFFLITHLSAISDSLLEWIIATSSAKTDIEMAIHSPVEYPSFGI